MLTRENTLLCVIDYQDALLAKIPLAEGILEQAVKLIRFARALELPIVWTEQYPKGLGPTSAKVAQELAGVTALDKIVFGCFGASNFVEAVQQTGRKQLLVIGIEAHVCVMQTVLISLEQEYEAYVVKDAVASRAKSDYRAGLARMQAHGAEIVTTEMAIFEILRQAGTPEFKKVLPLIK